MKQTRHPFWIFDYRSMRNQTEFDVSGAFVFSLIENRQSKIQNHLNNLNTLVYGKSPTLLLKETLGPVVSLSNL
jgi:hypothetical protein